MNNALNSPLITQLRSRYTACSPRERRMIQVMLIVVCGGLLWSWFMWQLHENARLDKALPEGRARLASLQDASAEITRLRALPKTPQIRPAQIVEALSASAQSMQLSLNIRIIDSGLIQVSAKGINFDMWVNWLAKAQQTQGVRLSSADLNTEGKTVSLEAQLSIGQ